MGSMTVEKVECRSVPRTFRADGACPSICSSPGKDGTTVVTWCFTSKEDFGTPEAIYPGAVGLQDAPAVQMPYIVARGYRAPFAKAA